jgi:eukaryotic-like serine/threonine-protein kinase
MGTWIPGFADDWLVPGYVEERELGQGASGRVVAAASVATGKRVAIKYLSSALVRDPTFMWRFRAEAALQQSLDVPQIVRVLDYAEEPGRGAAIVMELVDGVSLHEMIGQQGPASPEAALAVLKGSLLGLAAAHAAGIVHRDYKPENVLVDAEGSSKLADFGVAVPSGKRAPTAGTPLYMAPEQWSGAPSSPATDIYAVAAVFFECLTGKTPFSGRLPELRQQHEAAAVPLDAITAPALRSLIDRGMAKNPADRPQDAIAFASQLELVATTTYGADWEKRGRTHLAVRTAALLPLLLMGGGAVGSSGTSAATSWLGGHTVRQAGRQARRLGRKGAHAPRKAMAIGTAAVVVVAAAAAALALTGNKAPTARLTSSSSVASTSVPTVQAAVLPPVAASHCVTPSSFSYRGTVAADAPGPVSYRWVYSSGKQGPVQTVDFTEAGHREVTGETVATRKAGTGWGEIKMISPTASISNKASYKLLCASGAAGVSAAASIKPAAKAVTCGAPVPAFTATGSITSPKAQRVTYYWSLSDGRATTPASMTFTKPGTLPAQTLAITPQGDPSSGEAVLVVTSPVAASMPAPYTLSCTVPLHLTASAAVSPASDTHRSCTAPVPAVTFTGNISDNRTGAVSYYWRLPDGNGPVQTVNFAQAGTRTVTTTYRPVGDNVTGSGSVVVTSPGTATSNAATFTLSCTQATGSSLLVTPSVSADATLGQAYSGTVTVTGGKGPYKWAAPTGLPGGLAAAVNGATLTISGTPTKPGSFTVGVSVSDGESPAKTATASVPVTVSAPPLTVVTASLPSGTTGDDYSAAVTASGGTTPYTWSATGLPGGLTIDSATGTISGTLATEEGEEYDAPGTYPVTLTVKDSTTSAHKQFSLVVTKRPLTLEVMSWAPGTSGAAFSGFFWADDGTAPYTWTVTGLPAGLSFRAYSATEEEITGTAPAVKAPTTYSVTITVTDAAGATLSHTQSLEIDPAPAGE